MMRVATWFGCVCFLAAVGLTIALRPSLAGEPRPTVPVDGQAFSAALVRVDAEQTVELRRADGQTAEWRLSDLVSWGAPAEPRLGPIVYLSDGSWIAQPSPEPGRGPAMVRMVGERLEIERSAFGPLSLPLERVRAVLFQVPADAAQRDRLAARWLIPASAAVPPRAEGDLLLLENGDTLSGTIESCDGRRVELQAAVGAARIEMEKIVAIEFNPALLSVPERQAPRLLVGLLDGTRLEVSSIDVDLQGLHVSAPRGMSPDRLALWTAPAESLALVQPLSGRVAYLSDLTPASYKHLPFLSRAWPFRNDFNVTGLQLRAGGRLYAKGLGMHSAARLTYRLDKPYRWFEAEVAIDDETRQRGSVTYRVFVDSQQRYVSSIVRGGEAPLPVRVDLQGGKQLSLIVDYAERADELDHANWLNARLVE